MSSSRLSKRPEEDSSFFIPEPNMAVFGIVRTSSESRIRFRGQPEVKSLMREQLSKTNRIKAIMSFLKIEQTI